MTNVIYATKGLATHPPFLPFYAGIARVLGAVFLLYFGYKSHWYFALILYLVGFVGQFVLIRIEMAFGFQKKAWAISLIGGGCFTSCICIHDLRGNELASVGCAK